MDRQNKIKQIHGLFKDYAANPNGYFEVPETDWNNLIRDILDNYCESESQKASNEDGALPIQHVGQSLPDDDQIAKVVERIAYERLAEEQIDDACNKIGFLRQKLKEWFNIKD